MARKLLIGLFLLVCSSQVYGQKASFGVKAGLNFAKLANSNLGAYHMIDKRKTAHVGVIGNFKISDRLALQPELVYSAQGAIRNFGFVDNRVKLHYLNLPILVQFYTGKNFHFDVGGQVGYLAAARLKGTVGIIQDNYGTRYITTNQNIRERYIPVDFAYCLGFGFDLSENFAVSSRYNFGFTNIEKNTDPLAIREREKYGPLANRVIQFAISYTFGKAKVQPNAVDKPLNEY